MSRVIKGMCLFFIITLKVGGGGGIAPLEIMGLLLLAASFVYREKYVNYPWLLPVEALLILLLSRADPVFIALYGAMACDLAARGLHLWAVLLAPAGFFFFINSWSAAYLLLLATCGCAGYLSRMLAEKESAFKQAYDRERQTRYTLEQTKARLLHSAREAAHLAEIRERNRIAREIHDSVGHNLAGILLQLQAAAKLQEKDPAKSRELLSQSITGLAGSVELLRDTVHNIRPREQLGLSYFEKIIENYRFCPVDFEHSGDFSLLSPHQVEILSATLKEALTNAARHSGADRVEVRIDIHERIIRLYIKDNGAGCSHVREGLGLSGMKERVRNAGGQITITPTGGFMIVCILPRDDEYRGGERGAVESFGG